MGDRVQAAQAEALRRFRSEERHFVPLRLGVVGVVLIVALTSAPAVGLSGRRLGLSISLVVFVVEMIAWPIVKGHRNSRRLGELAVMGASAIAIAVFQPNGVSELPASAVVFIAGVALAPPFAMVLGGALAAGVALALGSVDGASAASVAASALLCAVLGVTGALLRQHRLGQDRTELLLAELEEARDDQARAAANKERARIARDLHDVLAHSLSGLSIQLEVARKLASATQVPHALASAIDRAGELAKEGLVEARDAVGALRREDHLSLEHLPELVEHFRRDLQVPVTYAIEGEPRAVGEEVGLALYRVTGEALTNVARHAAGAVAHVELFFDEAEVRLVVSDEGGAPGPLAGEGGGWGIAGLRERLKVLGGDLVAGPSALGWTVVASAPA